MAIVVPKRLERTRERWSGRDSARTERRRHLDGLGRGGDWRKIDEPRRILRRLVALGQGDVASEAMASVEARETEGRAIPVVNVLERLVEADDLLDVGFLSRGARAARAVGRIVKRTDFGSFLGWGTGFMVSPRILITNHHVLETAAEAAPSTVQFGYHRIRPDLMSDPVEFQLDPDRFFLPCEELDFTLVAVRESSDGGDPLETRGWLPLIAESGKAIVGEWVNIVQHPGGEPQKVALRENEVVDVFDDWMHYTTDTGPGSSGSPVLNDQWEVAALHHSGVPRVDDEGCPLLRTGEPWDGSTETEDLIDWVANEGVRVSRIVAWLEGVREDLDPDGRDLVDEMLEAPAPPVHESLRAGGADAGVEPGGSWIDGDGRLHLVVPLHVRVGLDLPVEPENREAEADHVSDAGGGDDRAGADGSGKDLE